MLRVTLILFVKSGAMTLYTTKLLAPTDVPEWVTTHISDYHQMQTWGGELAEVVQKDQWGWVKTRCNKHTGEKAVIIAYKKS